MSACEQVKRADGALALARLRRDRRADLQETARALLCGEVAGVRLMQLDMAAWRIAVEGPQRKQVAISLVDELWCVAGGVSGGDLMALVKGVADAAR